MATLYAPYAGFAPSRDDSAYILALVPTIANGLAAITSANELFVIDRQNLASTQTRLFDGTPDGINCLVPADAAGQTLLCSGSSGTVAIFDVRLQSKIADFKIGRDQQVGLWTSG